MRRRRVLAAVAVAAAAGSGGCVDAIGGVFEPPPRLGWLAVSNESSAPQRFSVQVERDGELVHESTHRVAAKTPETIPGEVVECTWGDERGPYTVRGRVDGADWVETAVVDALRPAEADTDCVAAQVVYGRGGSENVAFDVVPTCSGVPGYAGGCPFANADR